MSWLAHLFFAFTGAKNEAGWPYGLWSGFGGSVPDILILTAMVGWYWHRTCHQHRCWRIGRHPVGATGIKTCRRHHPELGNHRHLTGAAIRRLLERDQP